jgi:hypothetical protein
MIARLLKVPALRRRTDKMITAPGWLYFAYVFNILILIPVVYSMFFGAGVENVFEGKVVESAGLRLMVGSLWFAILVASLAGLIWPSFFAPVLIIQVIYKSLWLLIFVIPLLRLGQPFPVGITLVFAAIVASYPVFFWLASRPTASV